MNGVMNSSGRRELVAGHNSQLRLQVVVKPMGTAAINPEMMNVYEAGSGDGVNHWP